jgi:hypothetical protein
MSSDDSTTRDVGSNKSEKPDGGSLPTGSHVDTSNSSGGQTVAPAECTIPTFDHDAKSLPFARLGATVVDEQGAPVAGILAQACGTNVCLQAKTDTSGRVTIVQNESIAKLAFKYGDGLRYAQVVVPLPDAERHDLGEQSTLRLPLGDAVNRFEAGASLESSGARLELDDNTTVKLDRLSYPDESDHVFVARLFERETLPSSVAAQDFAAVWVFGPHKTEFCPPAKLDLPNTTELASGASVELWLLVTGTEGHFAPYAEWGKVGTATVSSDGSRIETNPNSGLPQLGIIGLRNSE